VLGAPGATFPFRGARGRGEVDTATGKVVRRLPEAFPAEL